MKLSNNKIQQWQQAQRVMLDVALKRIQHYTDDCLSQELNATSNTLIIDDKVCTINQKVLRNIKEELSVIHQINHIVDNVEHNNNNQSNKSFLKIVDQQFKQIKSSG